VALNAAAIPATLIESALFGHERGAFTGAETRADGAFQRAHRGTLFLDELGELSLAAQARLLRVLESGEVLRVGGGQAEHLDVRIVAATHRDLYAAMREGTFREDLFYRLSVLQVPMPPLRDRPSDVPLVAETLLRRLHPGARIEDAALIKLASWSWPGNVRELRNVLTRAVVLHGPWIRAEAIAFDVPPPPRPAPGFVAAAGPTAWGEGGGDERARLAALMAEHRGNRSQMARALGIPRTSLLYRLRLHGLSD
jgi:two-component system response regulator AtoC